MSLCKISSAIVILACLVCSPFTGISCSMYKVSVGDQTMVGCNEDSWRTTSCIWFETAKSLEEFGACFTGSRSVGPNRFAPQSGMNEGGLVFSRLTAFHPRLEINQDGKKQITDEVEYLSGILHNCETVNDVKEYIDAYDHSFFFEDVFIYIDKSGGYLIVEPYKTTLGNSPSYVLANFCPSLTTTQKARNYTRYRNGEDYIATNSIEASLEYCTIMSDTMHVSRKRNGDGTLLTSIWDTQNGLVNLYFYHSYDSTIQFNLSEELAKGNHIISIPELFPENSSFERLKNYTTPFNTPILRFGLVGIAGLLTGLSFVMVVFVFWKRLRVKINHFTVLTIVLNGLMVIYLFILATNKGIYYFDAPYQHFDSRLISYSSYLPFVLLVFIIPLTVFSIRIWKRKSENRWMKKGLLINNSIFWILLFGFQYWGLFQVIN